MWFLYSLLLTSWITYVLPECLTDYASHTFLYERSSGDHPCVYTTKTATSTTLSFTRAGCRFDNGQGRPLNIEEADKDNLKAKVDSNAFVGCMFIDNKWIWNATGATCAPKDPTTPPTPPYSLIVAIDGRGDTNVVDYVADFVNNAQTLHKDTMKIVAFAYGCQNSIVKQSYGSNFDATSLKSQIGASCKNKDTTYTFSSLFSDLAYYYYSAYPVVKPPYAISPIMLFTTMSNGAGIAPLSPRPNSNLAILYVGTESDNLGKLSIPANKVMNTSSIVAADYDKLTKFFYSTFFPEQHGLEFAASAPTNYSFYNASAQQLQPISNNAIRMNVLCEAPAKETTIPDGDCPSRFEKLQNGTRCFYISGSTKMTFAEATTACANEVEGGNPSSLAIIETQEEMNFILQKIENGGYTGEARFWIGLSSPNSCVQSKDDFDTWVTGDDIEIDHTFWRKNYPLFGPEEKCVALQQTTPQPTHCTNGGGACVALAATDLSWVNTYCENEYIPICSSSMLMPKTVKPQSGGVI